jgi:hypothetical protein
MNLNIPSYSLSVSTQTTIPRNGKVINVAQVSKDLSDDSHIKIILQKINTRTLSVTTTYMQSLRKNLQAGFQMNYLALIGQCSFSYCAMYVMPSPKYGQHSFFISYEPLQAKCLHLAYIAKVSKRLQLFSELSYGCNNQSDFVSGFMIRFMKGSVAGYVNSNLHMYGTYTKSLCQERVVIQFNT